jgi:hypothetical protein
VNYYHAAGTASNNAANQYLQSTPLATLLAAPVNVVTWAPDPVALPPCVPPIPLHIRDPTPPPPLAAVSVASGLNVDPSTTSTDEGAARLYVVPPIVTAGAPGVMVMPATTTGARLVTEARVPVKEPTTRSGEEDAGLYIVPLMVIAGPPGFMVVLEVTTEAGDAVALARAVLAAFPVVAGLYIVPPMVTAGLPGFIAVPEVTTEAGGAVVLTSVLADEPTVGVEERVRAVLAAFTVVAGLVLAGVDCLPVELEVDCG